MKGYYTHGDYWGYDPETASYEKFPTSAEYEAWYKEKYERES